MSIEERFKALIQEARDHNLFLRVDTELGHSIMISLDYPMSLSHKDQRSNNTLIIAPK